MGSSVEMHNALADGFDGGLGAVGNAKFKKQGLQIALHAFFADGEIVGDFLVAAACDDQAQNSEFTRGKVFAQVALTEAYGDVGWQNFLSAMDGLDGIDELGAGKPLEQVPARTGLDCTVNVLVAVVSGDDEDTNGGPALPDRQRGLDPATPGNSQVHKHDIRGALFTGGDGTSNVRGVGDDLQMRVGGEHGREANAQGEVIIDDENADAFRHEAR